MQNFLGDLYFLKDKKKIPQKIKIDDLLFLRSKGNLSVENLEKLLEKNQVN